MPSYIKKPRLYGPCAVCGDWYDHLHYKRDTCSMYCNNRRRQGHRDPFEKACEHCGEPMMSKPYMRPGPPRKYCSEVCRRLALGRAPTRWKLRQLVYEIDGFVCQVCSCDVVRTGDMGDPRQAQVDHIIPIDAGGPDTINNVWTLCRRCNREKSKWVTTWMLWAFVARTKEMIELGYSRDEIGSWDQSGLWLNDPFHRGIQLGRRYNMPGSNI